MNVICFGDSNTFGYDPCSRCGEPYDAGHRWVDILAAETHWNVRNQGMNGREIPDEPVSMPDNTDLLIVMLGTNDLLQFWTPEDAAAKMEQFLSGLTLPPEKILLIAPPPMVWGDWVQDQGLIDDSVTLTDLYRELAGKLGIRFADAGQWGVKLAYDGVHFTEEGSRAFAEGLLTFLGCGE